MSNENNKNILTDEEVGAASGGAAKQCPSGGTMTKTAFAKGFHLCKTCEHYSVVKNGTRDNLTMEPKDLLKCSLNGWSVAAS